MASQPTFVVFAGVNGAGKSTFYQSGLWRECDTDSCMLRINPDEIIIAAGKDWSSPTDQLWAGKQAVGQVRDNFAHMRSFNQETTLAGKSAVRAFGKRIRWGIGFGSFISAWILLKSHWPEFAIACKLEAMIFAPRTSSGVSLRAFPPWVRFCPFGCMEEWDALLVVFRKSEGPSVVRASYSAQELEGVGLQLRLNLLNARSV